MASIMAVAAMSVSVGLGGVVSAASSGSSTPAGTGPSASPNDVVYYYIYRSISKQYQGAFSGDWRHCVYQTAQPSPSTLICTYNVTVTEEMSGSGGLSAGVVSGVVGFNVSYSTSFGNGESWPMAPWESGWGDMGFRYNQYYVGIESELCERETGQCFGWSGPTWVTVQQYLGNTYYFFAT
jgi:hypothetical protein